MAKITNNYSITLPVKLANKARAKSKNIHGPRGFSKYITALIVKDRP